MSKRETCGLCKHVSNRSSGVLFIVKEVSVSSLMLMLTSFLVKLSPPTAFLVCSVISALS